MWQKALQLHGGGNTKSVEGSLNVSNYGHAEIDIFSNNIGMIHFITDDKSYYAIWKLEGTTFSKINGNATSEPFTFSDNKMIINIKTPSTVTFTYVIGEVL